MHAAVAAIRAGLPVVLPTELVVRGSTETARSVY